MSEPLLCIAAGGTVKALAVAAFTLAWTHSVEKVAWSEDWEVRPAGLALVTARVAGSGAGMEPGDGAVLENGFWTWHPDAPSIPRLTLARSGAVADWQLCIADVCRSLDAYLPSEAPSTGPLALYPCAAPD